MLLFQIVLSSFLTKSYYVEQFETNFHEINIDIGDRQLMRLFHESLKTAHIEAMQPSVEGADNVNM